jgi:leucyl-tRNA synthetase
MQRNWIGREEGSDGSAASYRLRDWCISRQRYWGTPIPIVYCASCGVVPVPEADLPVRLPDMDDFAPKGESPLASVPEFAHTICPTCGGPARRKCDTMTGFVCSSWYFLRFTSPNEADRPFDPEAAARWLPVTQYVGGKEHAVGHLLYARFVTRFLQDIGWVDFEEPFTRLYNQGVVHKDGDKMSKSKGNAVSVDAMVETYGADAARVFALFAAPPDGDVAWNEAGIEGIHRFLSRVWRAVVGEEESAADAQSGGADGIDDPTALNRCTHRAIKAVTEDLERMSYNTAISRLMELTTAILQTVRKDGGTTGAARVAREAVVSMLAPFAPHISEELWHRMGKTGSVHRAEWPAFDAALAEEEKAEIVVQIDGRVRDRFEAEVGTTAEELEREAMGRERIRSLLEGKEVRRVVVVPNSLVNVVTG